MGGQSPMFFTGVLLAVLISPALAGPWAIICAGKSSNEIRTCDSHGCGQYTAQRNQRLHQGVDVLCSDGSTVYAPFTGMIVGQEKPFKNRNAINNGVRISGRGPTYRGPSAFTHPPCGKSPHSRRHNWNEYTEQLAECWRSGIAGLLGTWVSSASADTATQFPKVAVPTDTPTGHQESSSCSIHNTWCYVSTFFILAILMSM
uniref:Leukocyte cell-derived chemotaxin-2 n=2 Tax=Sus scrofa TaxID=9823 RepID=A0A480ZW68_PIG